MRDMHCHILPGVDDGSSNLRYSLAMLNAAKAAGITSIVCTPHCRDPYFNYDKMEDAFTRLQAAAPDFNFTMGFEVNHYKLMKLGVDQWAPYLGFEGTGEFLLELEDSCTADSFRDYDHTIYQLQSMGYSVIIAHPERYEAIRKDVSWAQHLVDLGCKLQCSADFINGGRLGNSKHTAKKLFKMGLYSYIASDAHRIEHYDLFAKAVEHYSKYLRP